MKILITGATGYTGGKLAEYFSKEHQVLALRREDYEGSYSRLDKIFKENQIDLVIHTAALSKYSYDKIDDMIDSNFRLGVHLLEAMASNGCKKLINFGSYWQSNEEGKPICLYAALKSVFEGVIDFYSFDKGLQAISLRFTEIYGPDDCRPKLFTQFKNCSGKIKMTAGEQEVNLIHIDDVISATHRCLSLLDEEHEAVYSVHGEETFTPKEILKIFNEETGRNIEAEWGALEYYPNQILKLNLGKLLPGFKAKKNFKDEVKKI